jgi:hypothetical protein
MTIAITGVVDQIIIVRFVYFYANIIRETVVVGQNVGFRMEVYEDAIHSIIIAGVICHRIGIGLTYIDTMSIAVADVVS